MIAKIDAKFIQMVNDYLEGETYEQLAKKYNVTVEDIVDFLSRQEVKNYIGQKLQQYGYLNPVRRIKLLNRMIDEKVEAAEQNGAVLTKKDITELIKLLQAEQGMIQKDSEVPAVQVNIQTEYKKLLEELKDD
jgi:hypothetical protein